MHDVPCAGAIPYAALTPATKVIASCASPSASVDRSEAEVSTIPSDDPVSLG
jgi:hypothetical protein